MSTQSRSEFEPAPPRVFGVFVLATGAVLSIWAVVAIADTTTPLLRWHAYLLVSGIIVVGWGIPLVVPRRWRQAALASMVLVTPLLAVVAYFTTATIP